MPGSAAVVSPILASRRRDEERALFERLGRGDPDAREAILRRFLPLAHKLARGYRGGEESDDLEQVAAIGLLKAIDRFDASRGLAFSTFAFPTIMGELKRYFRDRAWSVKVPRSLQELALRVHRVSEELSGWLGRAPTVAELAEAAGASLEQVLEALQAGSARRPDSLDQPRETDVEETAMGLRVGVDDPEFARVDADLLLEGLLQRLMPRDRLILELRFRDDLTQSQIGRRVGVSQMNVSRSIRASIETLQRGAESGR
jgi:RNA polymerase sigma-B factor